MGQRELDSGRAACAIDQRNHLIERVGLKPAAKVLLGLPVLDVPDSTALPDIGQH